MVSVFYRQTRKYGGIQRGQTAPFGTRLCMAKCSVLYALAALLCCCENAVARGHATGFETAGKQAVFVVRITTNAELVSSAGRAYMKTFGFHSMTGLEAY